MHAVWVHDVLLLFKGLSRARVQPLPVAAILQPPQPVAALDVKRLGDAPQAMRLRLDNEAEVTVAVSGACGAAALPHPAKALPTGGTDAEGLTRPVDAGTTGS